MGSSAGGFPPRIVIYVRFWPCLAGQGDGQARCVSFTTHRAPGRLFPVQLSEAPLLFLG